MVFSNLNFLPKRQQRDALKNTVKPIRVSQSVIQSLCPIACRSVTLLSLNQSVNQSINQSVSQSISQSVSQSVNKSINQTFHQSINQSINQAIMEAHQIGICVCVLTKIFVVTLSVAVNLCQFF